METCCRSSTSHVGPRRCCAWSSNSPRSSVTELHCRCRANSAPCSVWTRGRNGMECEILRPHWSQIHKASKSCLDCLRFNARSIHFSDFTNMQRWSQVTNIQSRKAMLCVCVCGGGVRAATQSSNQGTRFAGRTISDQVSGTCAAKPCALE
eukprot:2923432-Amphidinium_carterae.1